MRPVHLNPSNAKAVLRVCALYAARCSGISPGGIEMVSVCTVPARGGRSCEHFGGYKTINRIPLRLLSKHKSAKIFENHLNPILLVFIRKLSLSTLI